MKNKRVKQIAEEIKRIVSNAIMLEMKDPRLPAIVTINSVEVTNDLRNATIYVSALAQEPEEQQEMVDVLNGAKGFFRQQIGKNLKTYSTPEPSFVYDDSIVRGMEMEQLLRKLKNESEHAESDNSSDDN